MPCSVGLRIAQHDSVSSHERDAYAVRLVSAYFFRDLIESVHVGDIELSPDLTPKRDRLDLEMFGQLLGVESLEFPEDQEHTRHKGQRNKQRVTQKQLLEQLARSFRDSRH